MEKIDHLLSSFEPISKKEWLAKVEKDLKGRPLSDLNWHLEHDLVVDPFAHPDDLKDFSLPLSHQHPGNNWEIGEYIPVYDPVQANGWALEGLRGGVEAIRFQLYQHLDENDLRNLLDGIDITLVSIHFVEMYTEKEPLDLVHNLHAFAEAKGFDPRMVRGSIDFDPLLDWNEPPLDLVAEVLQTLEQKLPSFKSLQVNGQYYHAGPKETSRELGYMLAKGAAYLSFMESRGLSPSQINRGMQLTTALSTSYFVEIAKLRALRILWLNVLKGFGIEGQPLPEIVGHMAKETQDDNQYTNMIRASTQAMSAVIGGVDRLYVLPANTSIAKSNANDEEFVFTRRIARNVQHLLKMESHLDKVADPGAGSYYIEQLTEKLAQKAWAVFLDLEDKGAFHL